MRHESLQEFISSGSGALNKGPVAIVLLEDNAEVLHTIAHHINRGFHSIVVVGDMAYFPTEPLPSQVHLVPHPIQTMADTLEVVNALIDRTIGQWLYYCDNAEYLFYPFCETRTVGELLAFHTEERRDAMLTYVVDLYANDLSKHQNAVDPHNCLLDKSGYYALARNDQNNHNYPKERQLDFFGGLRWRYEEFIPEPKQKIDRVALFRADKGLRLKDDHTFNVEDIQHICL
jgi:hypothetical protein